MTPRNLSLLSAVIISALHLASFLLPTAMLGTPRNPDWYPGWMIFVVGWMGPLMGHFGWFANFLVPIAVVHLAIKDELPQKFRISVALALSALALNSLFWRNIPNDAGGGVITRYGLGYYFWMAAVALSAAALFRSGGSGDEEQTVH